MMETHFRHGGSSREPRPIRVHTRAFPSTSSPSINLRDGFELDRLCSSNGDDHPKVRVKNHDSSPPYVASGNHSNQQMRRESAGNNDELVKNMSNLPRYLEKGVKRQEKAFNVGVLDWSLLEKWQSSKQVPYRCDGSSSSNSNITSPLTTEQSSTSSGTGHSSSAAHYRHKHPVYRFQLKELSSEASFPNVKSTPDINKNQLGLQEDNDAKQVLGSSTFFSENGCLDSRDISHSSEGQNCSDSIKGKKTGSCRRSLSMSLDHASTEKVEKPVYARHHDDLKVASGHSYAEENERRCNEISSKVQNSELRSDISHLYPLPCDANYQSIKLLRPRRTQEATRNNCASTAGLQLHSAGKLTNPSKDGSSEDDHRVLMSGLPTVKDLSQCSRISKQTVEAAKARHFSHSGRFSFGIGTGKKSGSTKDAEVIQDCSAHAVGKSCTTREAHSTSLEKSSHDKAIVANKARSSPLKRLLDPLLKPRGGNNRCYSKPLNRDSKSDDRVSKTLDRPSTAPEIRVSSRKSTSSYKSHYGGKNEEQEVVQALLQVVVQNGCPLFTFAVDSIKDILCAAPSKISTKKEFEDRDLYTIFSIQELKNKSWINLRGKGSGHEYSPNVVAQMKFSKAQHLITGQNLFIEFVLSTMGLEPGEKTDLQYLLNDELAAVVVVIPEDTDDKLRPGKVNEMTVILPSGIHTLPSKGKPSSLIARWRSGGQCDCGGWDSGCKLRILTDSKCQSSPVGYKLFDKGGSGEAKPVFNLAPYKDKEGVLSVSFSSSISPLQAFSISLAILDVRKHSEAKSSYQPDHVIAPGSYVSVPPHSPVGRV